jgi:hypothetical protein
MTTAAAAQAVLDKVLLAQSVHLQDAHSGELTPRCSTCVALNAAIEAARIAAIEGTIVAERTVGGRTRRRKG